MEIKRIKRNLNILKENIDLLLKNKELLDNEKDKIKVKFYRNSLSKLIEEIIESAIKINSILLKEKNVFFETYFQSFIKLNEEFDLNDLNFFEKIAKTTSFRNNLVHNYTNYITQKNLENFDAYEFRELYLKYIEIINNLIKNIN